MKFAIQVNCAPWQTESSDSAYQFIRAALRLGHQILRVFFYYDGAYHGLQDRPPSGDETSKIRRWSALAVEHGIDLVVCISAAQRRGVWDKEAMSSMVVRDDRLAEGFRIAGMGLWVDACLKADRFIEFGG